MDLVSKNYAWKVSMISFVVRFEQVVGVIVWQLMYLVGYIDVYIDDMS